MSSNTSSAPTLSMSSTPTPTNAPVPASSNTSSVPTSSMSSTPTPTNAPVPASSNIPSTPSMSVAPAVSAPFSPSDMEIQAPIKKVKIEDTHIEKSKHFEPTIIQSVYGIFHFIVALFAIYLSFKCNNGFHLGGFLLAILCPYIYIIYHFATSETFCGIRSAIESE